jgi:putative tryptophan/tyrosine transport system substrate-binding protein
MRRREFITLVGGAVLRPLVAHAQQPKIPVVGYLSSVPSDTEALAAFRQGLADFGFIEDQNVTVLYRYANGEYERLPVLAVDLVDRQVDVIVALPSSPVAIAAKQATYHSNRLLCGQRPGPPGSGRQSQPTGWQRHGHEHVRCGPWGEKR